MNTAGYVDKLIEKMKAEAEAGRMTKSEAAWTVSLACVGWSYTYGAWGALCTPAERRKRFGYHPEATTIKTKCKGFDSGNCKGCQWYPDNERTRTFDCRGFDDYIEKMWDFDLYGDTVASQWGHASNWCAKGKVADGIPDNVLVHLFICKDNKWTHTGFGFRGESCECSSGVQHFAPMKKNRWTHWAVCACYADEYTGTNAAPVTPAFEPIKKGMKGERVKALQTRLLALGYSLPRYGADGDFGKETLAAVKAFQADHDIPDTGIVDQATQTALDGAKPVKYTVIVPDLTEAQADALTKQYPGAIKEERGND